MRKRLACHVCMCAVVVVDVSVDDVVGQVMMESLVALETPDLMIGYLVECYERSCVEERKVKMLAVLFPFVPISFSFSCFLACSSPFSFCVQV